MSVSREEVERMARLARLTFSDDQAERLTHEMNTILEHATRLRELHGRPGEETTDFLDDRLGGSTRGTQAEEPDVLDSGIAAFAPNAVEGFFVVPPPPGVSLKAVDGPTDGEG